MAGVAEDVRELVVDLGLSQYLDKFVERGLSSLDSLKDVTLEELRKGLGMLPGHARLLHKRLAARKDGARVVETVMQQMPGASAGQAIAPNSPLQPNPQGLGMQQMPAAPLAATALPTAPMLPTLGPGLQSLGVSTPAPLVQQASAAQQQASAAMQSVVGEALTFMKTIMGEEYEAPPRPSTDAPAPSAFDQAELARRIQAAKEHEQQQLSSSSRPLETMTRGERSASRSLDREAGVPRRRSGSAAREGRPRGAREYVRSPRRRRSRSRSYLERRGKQQQSRSRSPRERERGGGRMKKRSGWDTQASTSAAATVPAKTLSLGQLMRDLGAGPGGPAGEIQKFDPSVLTEAELSTMGELRTAWGIPKYTIKIEQRFVGSVVGRQGESMKHIEKSTGAIVKLDHSPKALGFSICRIYGQMASADKAADLIRVKLAAVSDAAGCVELPEGFVAVDFPIEHGLVGLVMGRGGECLKQIRNESGAEVTFDKHSESRGEDRFRLVGRAAAVEEAKKMIRERIGKARTISFGTETNVDNQPGSVKLDIPVQQQFVGRIIGKNKETVREISERTGAKIEIEQSTQDQGFSTVRITGQPAAAESAKQLVLNRVKAAATKAAAVASGTAPAAAPEAEKGSASQQYLTRLHDDAVPVEQRFVGFIMGPGGRTLRQIKEQSGAKIIIDQETRDQGYSIVRIGDAGSNENLVAKELIEAKIRECQAFAQNQPPQAASSEQQQQQQLSCGDGQGGQTWEQLVGTELGQRTWNTEQPAGHMHMLFSQQARAGLAGTVPAAQQWAEEIAKGASAPQTWKAQPGNAAPPPPPPPPPCSSQGWSQSQSQRGQQAQQASSWSSQEWRPLTPYKAADPQLHAAAQRLLGGGGGAG